MTRVKKKYSSSMYVSVILLIEQKYYCLLEHWRNKTARHSTFTCSLKSISSYHLIYFSLLLPLIFLLRVFQRNTVSGREEEEGRKDRGRDCLLSILYSSSFQSSFNLLKMEIFTKTQARLLLFPCVYLLG